MDEERCTDCVFLLSFIPVMNSGSTKPLQNLTPDNLQRWQGQHYVFESTVTNSIGSISYSMFYYVEL